MLIKFKHICSLFCAFTSLMINAQEFSASIKYQGVINKKYADSIVTAVKNQKDVAMSIKQGVADMYKNATSDDYILNIKNNESYYFNVPSLNTNSGYNVGSTSGKSPYYSNNSTNSTIEISPYLGNIEINPLNWDITKNLKKIGVYACYQAVTTEKLYSRKGYYYERKVIAWFTPDIPLNFGPKNYNGLPGLVLEVQTGQFDITATDINLNPKEFFEISIPKGKIISEQQSREMIKSLEVERKKGG